MQRLKATLDIAKDISLAEAGKYGSLTDFAFFDKVTHTSPTAVSCSAAATGTRLRHILYAASDWLGGSVAEWLACWTQAQKGLGSNRSREAVG